MDRIRAIDAATCGIQARIVWEVLVSEGAGLLGNASLRENEPEEDYGGLLEGMEAAQLLALMEKIQERLEQLGPLKSTVSPEPETLFIDTSYHIRIGSPSGPALPFRPLVRALFILFLRHPEGILLKERGRYEAELNEIYAIASPKTAPEERQARIRRLVNPEDNSFSEKASVLNATLDRLLPETAYNYKIQGYNGFPRRIPLSPLKVVWED